MASTASVGLGLTWIIFAMFLSPEIHRHAIAAYLYIEVIFLAMMTVSLFALFMRVSWPLVAATQFTAYMAMLNVSRMAGAAAAGNAAGWVTTPQAFMIAGIVQIALIGLIVLVDPTQTRRVLGELELSGQGAGGKEETAAPTGFAEIESRG
jgi:MFS transporter, PAT family, beta-lactamase induction signal transducer AmpG